MAIIIKRTQLESHQMQCKENRNYFPLRVTQEHVQNAQFYMLQYLNHSDMLIRWIYFSCLLWLKCSWKRYMRSENRQIIITMLKRNILQLLLSTDTKVMFVYSKVRSSGNGFSELDRHLSIIWKTQAIFTRLSLH